MPGRQPDRGASPRSPRDDQAVVDSIRAMRGDHVRGAQRVVQWERTTQFLPVVLFTRPYEEFANEATQLQVGGWTVLVTSKAHLIADKMAASRDDTRPTDKRGQDIADLHCLQSARD